MNEDILGIQSIVEKGIIPYSDGANLPLLFNSNVLTRGIAPMKAGFSQYPAKHSPKYMATPTRKARWLIVMIQSGERKRLNVRIPLGILGWALRCVPESVRSELRKEFGPDFNISEFGHITDYLPADFELVSISDEEANKHIRILVR